MRPGDAVFAKFFETGVRDLINEYYRALMAVAKKHNAGVILDVPTWDAHTARGKMFGITRSTLHEFNRIAVADAVTIRENSGDLPTVIAGLIGPRDDAFEPQSRISEAEAEDYHSDQITVLAGTEIDCIDAFTLPSEDEAVGMVRAAKAQRLPIVVSFTLGTDGCLPSGSTLQAAISSVDERTDGYASYFLVNCVHPIHFPKELTNTNAIARMRGMVANASFADHADLNESNTLDSGDPADLGSRLHQIGSRFSHFNVFGGCCGTDMRHMSEIARHL